MFMQISLTDWRAMRRNSLRGFASVRIGGLLVRDISVHNSHGKRWASLPSKPLINGEGVAKRTDAGKIQYVPILEWSRRELSDEFSEAVIEALEREHPGSTSAD